MSELPTPSELRDAQRAFDAALLTSFIFNLVLSLVLLVLLQFCLKCFALHFYAKRTFFGAKTLELEARRRTRVAFVTQNKVPVTTSNERKEQEQSTTDTEEDSVLVGPTKQSKSKKTARTSAAEHSTDSSDSSVVESEQESTSDASRDSSGKQAGKKRHNKRGAGASASAGKNKGKKNKTKNSLESVEATSPEIEHPEVVPDDESSPSHFRQSWIPYWAYDMWSTVKDDDLLESNGLDTVTFLLCMRILVKMTGLLLGPGVLVGIANAAGQRHLKDNSEIVGTAIITLSNVEDESWIMVVHAVATICTAVSSYYVLYHEYLHFMRLRQRWRTLPRNQTVAQTIMFTGVPRKDVPDSETALKYLRRVFDLAALPGTKSSKSRAAANSTLVRSQVQSARLVSNFNDVLELQQEKWAVTLKLEKAIATDQVLLEKFNAEQATGNDSAELEMAQAWTGLPFISSKLPAVEFYESEIVRLDAKIREALRRKLSPEQMSLLYPLLPSHLPNQSSADDPDSPGQDSLSIDDIAQEAKAATLASGVVFATFSSATMANMAGQTAIKLNSHTWKASPAVEPEAVIWEHLPIAASSQKRVRMWIGRVCVLLLVFFWMIPVSFVAALANLESLKSISWLSWIADIVEFNIVISGIISGILPQLALILFMALLKPLITFIVFTIQARTTRASTSAAFFSYFFTFQVVNVFLGVLFAGSLFAAADYLTNLSKLVSALADALPPQVNFFISYVMLLALTGEFQKALNPFGLLLFFLEAKFLAKTERQLIDLRLPHQAQTADVLSTASLIFVICLTYSTIAPLIVPFGLLAQVVIYTLHKREMVYASRQTFDTGGALFVPFFRCAVLGLLLNQLVLTGVFGLKLFPLGSTVAIIFAVASFLFVLLLPRQLDRQLRYGALGNLSRVPAEQNRLLLHDAYAHPATLLATEAGRAPQRDQGSIERLKDTFFQPDAIVNVKWYFNRRVAALVEGVRTDPRVIFAR